MITVNVNKLNGKIHECGYNKTTFSKELGIDRNTLAAYLRNPKNITYGILNKMIAVLKLNTQEANEIFFAQRLTFYESY